MKRIGSRPAAVFEGFCYGIFFAFANIAGLRLTEAQLGALIPVIVIIGMTGIVVGNIARARKDQE